MKRSLDTTLRALALCGALFLLGSCEEESADEPAYRAPVTDHVRPGMPSEQARERIKAAGTGLVEKATTPDGAGDAAKVAIAAISETDFIESQRRRDPFRPVVEAIARQEQSQDAVQREIKLKEFDVSDLRLVALISAIGDPRAMVVTPNGDGFVLKRGDFVGRPEFVELGGAGGQRVQVNWRVARIHGTGKEEERGVYLVRDDPTTTKGVDVTRFLPLYPRE